MKVILPNGTIAESRNKKVIEAWKKKGYKEVKADGGRKK